MSAFTLADGKKARFDGDIPPEQNDDGEVTCGFDVLIDNGSHLEFTVTNTGWGKAMALAPDVKKGGKVVAADGCYVRWQQILVLAGLSVHLSIGSYKAKGISRILAAWLSDAIAEFAE